MHHARRGGTVRISQHGASAGSRAASRAGDAPAFVRDRRPEYMLFSQHTGGFLRRLMPAEEPGTHDELA